jgi:uncharacterized membrane protein HdeD (DUF308 family)
VVGEKERRDVPLLLWPFYALWRLLGFVLELTGRVLGIILGLVLVIAGIVASLTVIGAVVGIPLIVLGFMLMVRGLF